MKHNINICDSISDCGIISSKKLDTIKDKKAKSKVCFKVENQKNEKEFIVIPFEDCVFKLIQNETEKCDFGLQVDDKMFFIELKGSDNNKALKQILKTYELTNHCFKNFNFYARVVTSHKQKPENLDKITYKQIIKITKNNLIISQNIHTEIL